MRLRDTAAIRSSQLIRLRKAAAGSPRTRVPIRRDRWEVPPGIRNPEQQVNTHPIPCRDRIIREQGRAVLLPREQHTQETGIPSRADTLTRSKEVFPRREYLIRQTGTFPILPEAILCRADRPAIHSRTAGAIFHRRPIHRDIQRREPGTDSHTIRILPQAEHRRTRTRART